MTQSLKDAELQRYYDDMLAMLASPGWAYFLEDAARMSQGYADVRQCPSLEMLHFRKGQLDILDWLANRKAAVEAAYETLLQEESA